MAKYEIHEVTSVGLRAALKAIRDVVPNGSTLYVSVGIDKSGYLVAENSQGVKISEVYIGKTEVKK